MLWINTETSVKVKKSPYVHLPPHSQNSLPETPTAINIYYVQLSYHIIFSPHLTGLSFSARKREDKISTSNPAGQIITWNLNYIRSTSHNFFPTFLLNERLSTIHHLIFLFHYQDLKNSVIQVRWIQDMLISIFRLFDSI
jgi:hypothetical protein